MTRDEAIAILAVLKIAYPAFYKTMSDEEIDDVINLWGIMFESDSAKIVTEAVKALICTLKYPPTIADVKEKIAAITHPQTMTEMEAWQLVRQAISYYRAEETFAQLPPILQKIVGSPSVLRQWAQMEAETVDSVIQSNFMRSYKARVVKEKEFAMLPQSTKQLIAELSQKFSLTEGGHEPQSKRAVNANKVQRLPWVQQDGG